MSFIVIGLLGFIWMGLWIFVYDHPERHPKVNEAELAYIRQDHIQETVSLEKGSRKIPFQKIFTYKQTWSFAIGKFMTDGVWWFLLFWAPAYLSSVYGLSAKQSAPQLFVLYLITLLSIVGGWLPTYFIHKKGMNPYAGRMKAMLIFAFFPVLALFAQPLGHYSVWIPVCIIGIAGAAHQSWSANIYSTVSDMFPKPAVATVIGIGGMAGGLSSFLINKGSGKLFDHAIATNMSFMGFHGIEAGYFIIFSFCAVSYLCGWVIMKMLVPRYKLIEDL
jgi:ACS family hexuronate transporter-like MFS transporter